MNRIKHIIRLIALTLRQAITSFDEARASQASASIAYYAFFSLFPLILVLIAAGSYIFDDEEVIQTVLDFAYRVLPSSAELLEQNIVRVLELRTSVGIISLISLVWSATGVFSALAFNIDLAWQNARRRNFLQKRLVGLAMVGVLAFLYIFFLVLSLIARSLPAILGSYWYVMVLQNGTVVQMYNFFSAWAIIFLLYFALYRWVPSVRVGWKSAAITAAVTTVMWQLVLYAFSWFLTTGLNHFELVYGALGTIVVLLLIIYLYAWIVLFGAHLCASIRVMN